MAKALGKEDTAENANEYAFHTSWKSYPKYGYIWRLLNDQLRGVLGVLFSCTCLLLDSLLSVFAVFSTMEKTKEDVNWFVPSPLFCSCVAFAKNALRIPSSLVLRYSSFVNTSSGEGRSEATISCNTYKNCTSDSIWWSNEGARIAS